MARNRTLSLILPAFGAAIIAALAQIVIPIGAVPITLQTFAVGLVAAILKPREATLAATLYLILGAIGLPVLQVEAVGSKHSLVLQLAICWLIHFSPLSLQNCRMLRLLFGKSLWLLF